MRPTQEILDSHIVKMVTIKGNIPDTDSAYKKVLEENIELLIRIKTLRELSTEEKMEWLSCPPSPLAKLWKIISPNSSFKNYKFEFKSLKINLL